MLGARRADRLDALAHRIAGAGGEAAVLATDVTKRGDVTALVALAQRRFGRQRIAVPTGECPGDVGTFGATPPAGGR